MSPSFKYIIIILLRLACGIQTDDTHYVITGGPDSKKKVTRYTRTGDTKTMPELNIGRYYHACEKFVNDEGATVSSTYIEL